MLQTRHIKIFMEMLKLCYIKLPRDVVKHEIELLSSHLEEAQ